MLVSIPIPNMVNGVSQQAEAMRMSSQAEYQENYYSSVVEGLKRRPASVYVAELFNHSISGAYMHEIVRDAAERYLVTITDGAIVVHDLAGAQKTVNMVGAAANYLAADTPGEDFSALTVADYTFVVNKTKVAAMTAALSPDRGIEALVFIKAVNYSTDYKITIGGVQKAAHTTGTAAPLSTATVAENLKNQLVTNLGAGWTITRFQSVIHVKKNDASDFEILIEDSAANTMMRVAKNKIQRFSDLPTTAPKDFVVHILGDKSSSFDDYYVKFVPNNDTATFDEGVWVETVKPGLAWELDAATLPHALVREADGTFSFKAMTWAKRGCGDNDSCPVPSFVGDVINDMVFAKNRLGFMSDQNTILSESGEFFNFWLTTVTTLVESDPIDTAASSSKVNILRYALVWENILLLFSDYTQFKIDMAEGLSIKSGIDTLTHFESSSRAKPVASGKNVFFAVNRANFTSIQEYFITPDSQTKDASDITAHVPKFIPTGVFKLAAASNDDILLALTAQDQEKLYVYKYYWNGADKLQSSWSFWSFRGGKVLSCGFFESTLYLIVERGGKVYLEKMVLAPGYVDAGETIEFALDRKVTEAKCTVTYSASTNATTFQLPYAPNADYIQVVTRAPNPGVQLDITNVAGTSVTVRGNHATTPVFIGEVFRSVYQPTRPYVKEQGANGAQATLASGRFQVHRWTFIYNQTGYFRAEVDLPGRDLAVYRFTGWVPGSARLGSLPVEHGRFVVPISSRSDLLTVRLINDSFLPCHFISGEVEGSFNIRSKRL